MTESLSFDGIAGRAGPIVAEVLGPPGAGKSTLLSALSRQSAHISPIAGYRSLRLAPSYVRAGATVLPVVLSGVRSASDVSKQLNWMIRLEASHEVLRQPAVRDAAVALFDQGPAYTLVRLARPDSHAGNAFDRWWHRMGCRWRGLLTVLILVDAPDQVLIERIRSRSKPHALKDHPMPQARSALVEYRTRCEAVARMLGAAGGADVLRLDTSKDSLDDLVERSLATLRVTRGGAYRP